MPADMAKDVLEFTFAENKEIYKATLAAVAQQQKVRPQFLERKPRAERHPSMLNILTRASMEPTTANLLRNWLLKKHRSLLEDFLNAVGIAHKEGVVEDVPDTMEDAKVQSAVDILLGKHPAPLVSVYLHIFNQMNDPRWANLDKILETDSRLQF